MPIEQWTRAEIIHCLQWHIDLGCDELLDEQAIDRFQNSRPTSLNTAQEAAQKGAVKTDMPRLNKVAADRVETLNRSTETNAPSPPASAIDAVLIEPTRHPAPQVFAQSAQKTALPALSEITHLDELRRVIADFDGSSLKKMAKNLVFSDGQPQSRVMLVGEAPGREEDRQGLPFIGPSGQLLDQMLASIGLDRQNTYIANLIPWRPPGDRTPTREEIELFRPFLIRHIELAAPEIVVAVGGTAAKALLNSTTGITKLRGTWHDLTHQHGIVPVLPIFHPAFLLRTPARKAEAWADLCALKSRLDAAEAAETSNASISAPSAAETRVSETSSNEAPA